MKAKNYLVAIAIAFTAVSAQAQITGGGAGSEGGGRGKPSASKGVFDKTFYMKGGFSKPMGIFAEAPIATGYVIESFTGKRGMGAVRGGAFEMGSIAYFNSLPFPEKFALGIDVTFLDMSWNKMDWSHFNREWNARPFFFMGLKLGPVFSYNVIDQLIVDGFFKINPTMLITGTLSYEEYEDYNNNRDYSLGSGIGFGWRNAAGINVRYSAFLLGVEYNFGKMKSNIVEDYSGRTDGIYESGYNTIAVKAPMNKLYLTFGFSFNAAAKRPAGGGSK